MTVTVERMSDAFTKYHLPGGAVLHRFTAPDSGPPHDHPWSFRSTVLHGGYTEQVFHPDGTSHHVTRRPGDTFQIAAGHIHRIVQLLGDECWTVIEPGTTERVPGFYRWTERGMEHRLWSDPP